MMKLWWKFRSYWFRFRWWVSDYMPIACFRCSRVGLVKNTRMTQTTWGNMYEFAGNVVWICLATGGE